jgi:hypothetical protein
MRIISLILASLFPIMIQAQVWQENFDNGCANGCSGNGYTSLNGVWNVTNIGVNGVNANRWFVSCAEDGFLAAPPCSNTCSNPAPGNATAHIGNVSTSTAAFLICPGGDCRAIYDDSTPAEASSIRLESPVISTLGLAQISLSMIYFLGGVNCSSDYAAIEYHDGTSWSVLVPCLAQTVNNCAPPHIGSYNLAYTVNLPASADNNPAIRIAFRWENDGNGTGTDPSFSIDNLVITNASLASDIEDFKVVPMSDAVQLRWVVREDAGIAQFVLERSVDGKDFTEISALSSREGNSSNIVYEWLDARPLGGKSYYRIRQEYIGGKTTYTHPLSVTRAEDKILSFESSNVLDAYSNPQVQVYSNQNRKVSYQLIDMTGRMYISQEEISFSRGYNELALSNQSLSPGWYILTIASSEVTESGSTISPLRIRIRIQ